MKKIIVTGAVCGFAVVAAAQTPNVAPTPTPTPVPAAEEPSDDIEVTSTRLPREVSRSASAVTVIAPQQIEARKPFDLEEILNRAPGLVIARRGSAGQVTGVSLRGTGTKATLVLVDGVRVNSSTAGGFDFGTIPVENIERIEVLRGPQSGLYGSDAMGGVIQIITKRGAGPFATGGSLEYGARATNKQVFTAGGELKKGRLSFSATRLQSDGYFVNDDYKNLGASLRYDYAVGKSGTLSFLTRLEDAKLGAPGQREFDADPNARAHPRNLTSSLQWQNDAGKRRDNLSIGLFDRDYKFNDPQDNAQDFFNNSHVKDRNLQFNGQSSWTLGTHTLTLGAEHRREKATYDNSSTFGNAQINPSRNNTAFFAQDEWRSGKLALVPSLRYERNQQFGSDVNGRLAASYEVGKGRFKASAGTGFHAPTFDDLYYPGFSNPNLQPEKSAGFDFGYARPLKNGGRAEATLFYNRLRNLINFDPVAFIPVNVDRATTRGVEFSLSQPMGKAWTLHLNQAFLGVKSAQQDQLLRRPKFSTAADLVYRKDKWNGDLAIIAQGRRFDDNFVFGPGALRGYYPSFTRVDLTLGYDVRPNLELYARFGNLLNRKYDEVAGYAAPGINFVIGIKAKAF